jgi:GGDEF domain-containing protein
MFVAQKILSSLNEPAILTGDPYPLSASIGISIFPDHAEDLELLIRYADKAMYAAKRQHEHIRFYQDQ